MTAPDPTPTPREEWRVMDGDDQVCRHAGHTAEWAEDQYPREPDWLEGDDDVLLLVPPPPPNPQPRRTRMRPVPDKPILLGGGSETVPDGWHVVYQCPLCRRYFDSPSVCLSDGAEAIPRLERKPRLARRDWSAGTDVASGGDGVSVADQTRTKITHGRHCICTPCRVEDWTNPALAPCGMHGRGCPQEYAPLGAAGDPVPAADLIEKGDTDA